MVSQISVRAVGLQTRYACELLGRQNQQNTEMYRIKEKTPIWLPDFYNWMAHGATH